MTLRQDYREAVFRIVRRIPPGKVMTYGGIAELIPAPQGIDESAYRRIRARWVGYALANCPDDLPWHRVVNSKGGISTRPGFGPQVQQVLLEDEGVRFEAPGRLNLGRYRHSMRPGSQG